MSTEPCFDWASWRGFRLLLGGYLLIHLFLRLTLSQTLLVDDAEQIVFIQSLAWGYGIGQPPLYTWLLWGVSQLLGPGLLAVTLLKYGLLFATYAYFYAAARRLFSDPRLALLAGLSLLLISPFAWRAHEGFTHTLLLALACIASYYSLLRLRGELRHYLLFGLWLGVGILAKYSFPLFALPLLAAALWVPEYRLRLLDRRLLLSLAVAVLIAAPHLYWLYDNLEMLRSYYAQTVKVDPTGSWLAGFGSGLYSLGKATLYYLTPFWLAALLLFPSALLLQRSERNPEQALLGGFLLFAYLLLVAQLLFGATYFKARWMHPVLLLFPLWFFGRVAVAGASQAALRRYGWVIIAASLFVIAARVAQMYAFPGYGKFERVHMPMTALSERVIAAGFNRGTLVAEENFIAAHLWLQAPAARVLTVDTPYFRPARGEPGSCLLAWDGEKHRTLPARLHNFARDQLGVRFDGHEQLVFLSMNYYGSKAKRYTLAYLLIKGGSGECR